MSQMAKEPDDEELKNIIDKLANFVARNGPEFELITKEKQKNNPKFQFLFDGEYHNYYVCKVANEQALLKIQSTPPPQSPIVPPLLPPPIVPPLLPPTPQELLAAQIGMLQKQIQQMQEQTHQSEKNLQAQREVMKIQRKIKVEEMLKQAKSDKLERSLNDCHIDSSEFDRLTNELIGACTKDAISAARNFCMQYDTSVRHMEAIATYLLARITNKEATHDARLHLIYLLNDIIHNCNKHGNFNLKDQIERVIVGAYCYAHERSDDEKREKLSKLLELWMRNRYFSSETFEKLQNPLLGLYQYEDSLHKEYHYQIKQIDDECDDKIKHYEKQHHEYVEHVQMQINGFQSQIQILQNISIPSTLPPPPFIPNIPPPNLLPQIHSPMIANITAKPPPALMSLGTNLDLSKPPPGIITKTQLQPRNEYDVPYYKLPAGLMIPLIKNEDFDYHPLDPKEIKQIQFDEPSESLLNAVEEFYNSSASRNEYGWERDGLFEFYKMKLKLRRELRNRRNSTSSSQSSSSSSSRKSSSTRSSSRSSGSSRRRRSSRSSSKSSSSTRSQSGSSSRSSSSRSRSPRRKRSRSRSRSPPRFTSAVEPYNNSNKKKERLDVSNKGHQLLQKMGWSGKTGLGAREQGIFNPIDGGEVRDKNAVYRGLGASGSSGNTSAFRQQDPFEQFRRNRSQSYLQKFKERDEKVQQQKQQK